MLPNACATTSLTALLMQLVKFRLPVFAAQQIWILQGQSWRERAHGTHGSVPSSSSSCKSVRHTSYILRKCIHNPKYEHIIIHATFLALVLLLCNKPMQSLKLAHQLYQFLKVCSADWMLEGVHSSLDFAFVLSPDPENILLCTPSPRSSTYQRCAQMQNHSHECLQHLSIH